MATTYGVETLMRLKVLDDFTRLFQQEVRKKRGRVPDFVVLVADRRSVAGAAVFNSATDLSRRVAAGGDRFAIMLVSHDEALALLLSLCDGLPLAEWNAFRKMRRDVVRVVGIGTPTKASEDLPCFAGGVTAPEGGWEAPFTPTEFNLEEQRPLMAKALDER